MPVENVKSVVKKKKLTIDDGFPTRREFASAEIRKKYVDKVISKNQPLSFIPSSVSESLPFEDYVLYLHGALLSGDKATVAVKNIPIFFDIRTPDGQQPYVFENELKLTLKKLQCYPTRIDTFEALGPRGFKKYGTYFRVYYKNLTKRKKAIVYFEENTYEYEGKDLHYETACDDKSAYYRKACREGTFSMVDWNIINDYTIDRSNKISKAEYVIQTQHDQIKWHNVDKTLDENAIYANDKQVVMCFDLETHSYKEDGSVPKPESDIDEIFMAGMAFYWRGEKKPFYRVGISTKDMDERDYDVMICKSERDLISAFYQLIGNMQPDYITEFNGGQYDWPWIIHRSIQYHLIPEANKMMSIMKRSSDVKSILKWNVKKAEIKLEAGKNTSCTNMQFPGYQCIDVRIKFRQDMQFKTAEESSLKFFLDECELDSKLDMPYDEMHRRFNRSDLDEKDVRKYLKRKHPDVLRKDLDKLSVEFQKKCLSEMAEVMDYCLVDAMRCQELLLAKNIITDMREIGVRSFTSMYECIYLADAMKVKNLILHEAIKYGIEFSSISRPVPKFKYPGAYVVDPETGLENQRPVTGLDFASLYPSLIRAYNLSIECTVTDENEAKRLEKEGYNLHYIEFPGPEGTTIKGWTVRHDNQKEKTGIYPYILGYLFDQRTDMKGIMKPLTKQLEHLGKRLSEATDSDNKIADLKKKIKASSKDDEIKQMRENIEQIQKDVESIEALKDQITNTKVKYEYINSKQKALKVFMNTFYGVMGDVTSPLFMLLLAGAVTSSGRDNLRKVAKYVKKQGYKIKYGDTDSLYLVPPDSVFTEVDKLYKDGKINKLEYFTQMVELTMKNMNEFKNEVNTFLEKDNGTKYLNMAYEEVLFPAALLTKKIYYGIPHMGVVNFKPEKLFIRGMAPIKRGFPDFIKKVDMEIMWESMSVENTKDLRQIVEDKLREIPTRKWTLEDFVQTAEYRPSKDQKTVKAFVETLKPEDRPKPGKRFKYIVVEGNPYYSTLEGHKKTKKKGEIMAYYETAKENNLKPNMQFYMAGVGGSGGMVVGQFARFISYHPDFEAPTDKQRMNRAKTHMKKLCKEYNPEFKSNDKVCKNIYKKTTEAVMLKCQTLYGSDTEILSKIKGSDPKKDILASITKDVSNAAKRKEFKEDVFEAVKRLCKHKDPHELYKDYTSGPTNITRKRRQYIMEQMRKYDKKLDELLPRVAKVSDVQNKSIETIVMGMREKFGVDEGGDLEDSVFDKLLQKKVDKLEVPDGYQEDLEELEKTRKEIYKIKMMEKWHEDILKYINYAKESKNGNDDPAFKVDQPKKDEIRQIAQSFDIPVF
jgi:DNA polymerase elongation subunit (family B)